MPSASATPKNSQNTGSAGQSDSQSAVDRKNASGQAHVSNRCFIGAVPAKGMHANKLIGAEVKTSADEDVGQMTDLIINGTGQVVAVVVSAGGFLGMGEREVAIGWDDETRSVNSDKLELQIGSTRDALHRSLKSRIKYQYPTCCNVMDGQGRKPLAVFLWVDTQ